MGVRKAIEPVSCSVKVQDDLKTVLEASKMWSRVCRPPLEPDDLEQRPDEGHGEVLKLRLHRKERLVFGLDFGLLKLLCLRHRCHTPLSTKGSGQSSRLDPRDNLRAVDNTRMSQDVSRSRIRCVAHNPRIVDFEVLNACEVEGRYLPGL